MNSRLATLCGRLYRTQNQINAVNGHFFQRILYRKCSMIVPPPPAGKDETVTYRPYLKVEMDYVPTDEPWRYRDDDTIKNEPSYSRNLALSVMTLLWFTVLYNLWYNPAHLFGNDVHGYKDFVANNVSHGVTVLIVDLMDIQKGHYTPVDAKIWTDTELGIPPDDADD